MADIILVISISVVLGFMAARWFSFLHKNSEKKDLPTRYQNALWVGVCLLIIYWYAFCKIGCPGSDICLFGSGSILLCNLFPMAIMDAKTMTVYSWSVNVTVWGSLIPFLLYVLSSTQWYLLGVLLSVVVVSFLFMLLGAYKKADYNLLISCVMVYLVAPDWDRRVIIFMVSVVLVHAICFFIPMLCSKDKLKASFPFVPSLFLGFWVTTLINS